ncbi:MAG TPA: hypothetical protein VOA78_10095 [Candidatus Dormibacteraeota bacterium]|nr:hypothetical protein [Candidatus Dormibacteraeota bacterium]
MSRWTRVLSLFGIVVVACITYLWFFGTQTFFVLEAYSVARKLPFVRRTPIEQTDLSISQAPGLNLSYFGYEFEVPWTDIDREKTKILGGNKAIIAFRSGNVLSVWSAPPHEFMNGLFEQGKIDRDTFRKVYGDEALQSDYNFQRLILETTPDKITLFSSKKTVVSHSVVLMLKAISVPGDPNSGIFAIQGKEFRGFQYGRVQNPPKQLSVELFPENGHLDLLFGQKKNGPAVISQADINRIVQTIHKVPAEVNVRNEYVHK